MEEVAVRAERLGKSYRIYRRPSDRLWQFILRRRNTLYREFSALHGVDFEIRRGQVLGVVGRNGAGKSTLMQMIAGTVQPSSGRLVVDGRVSALLELGAGFHPEFSGAENVRLYGLLMGLSEKEITDRFDAIVDFAGVRPFIHQPVKTYSSGMFVRLAFSIATSVDPDILIVDEALSVGDGAFARKSFDRIMALRERGVTIVFCSHALYQVQVLSDLVLWLEAGQVRALGDPRTVIGAYQRFLDGLDETADRLIPTVSAKRPADAEPGIARLTEVRVRADGAEGEVLSAVCERSDLQIEIRFASDPSGPCPTLAVVFTDEDGRNISSCTTYYDGFSLTRDAQGQGVAQVTFERFPLLHGRYWVNVLLMCERAIMTLDGVYRFVQLQVEQPGHEVGVTMIPRAWSQPDQDAKQ